MCMAEILSVAFTGFAAAFAGLMCWLIYQQTETTKKLERAWISVKIRHDFDISKLARDFVAGQVIYLNCEIINWVKPPERLRVFKVAYEPLVKKPGFPNHPAY